MNKLLISEISIDLHLQSFTHLAQQNLEGKKKRERKYIQLLTPFSLLLDKDVLTEGDHLLSHQAGGRKCQEGVGERTNSHSFAPVSISTIAPFPEQAQVLLLFRPFPRSKSKLQLFAVPVNQHITGGMATKGNSMV